MIISSSLSKHKIFIKTVYHKTEQQVLENSTAYQGSVELAVSAFQGAP